MQSIEFFYDLRSPYTYFAWCRKSLVSSSKFELRPRPVSISILLNLQAGREPWAAYQDPLCSAKRDHLMNDIPRMASYWNIPLSWPPDFKPQSTRAMCLATALHSSGANHEEFIDTALKLLWVENCDLETPVTYGKLLKLA
ncbi:MAG: DsbA family protein, partial [Cyanobacteria bacterium J06626_14]